MFASGNITNGLIWACIVILCINLLIIQAETANTNAPVRNSSKIKLKNIRCIKIGNKILVVIHLIVENWVGISGSDNKTIWVKLTLTMTMMMLYRERSGKSITSQTDRHIKVTGNVILVKWQWNARRRSQTNPVMLSSFACNHSINDEF